MFSLEMASIFATYPMKLTTFGAIIDQTIGTFLLITVYLALANHHYKNDVHEESSKPNENKTNEKADKSKQDQTNQKEKQQQPHQNQQHQHHDHHHQNHKHADISWDLFSYFMGLTVIVIGMSFGYDSAYAINPARDFSPRLFSLMVGWGTKTFTAGNYFFWIPLVMPMFGSFLATVFYNLLINNSK